MPPPVAYEVNVHTATKLRVRDAALKAIRAAIERDEEIFRNLP